LKDDVLTLSAGLAFYTLLSFAPLIVLAVLAASAVGPSAQDALLDQIGAIVGPSGKEAASAVIESGTSHPSAGTVAGILGVLTALLGATTVFAQLQASLNVIFGLVAKPTNALWGWVRRRILSVGVIFAIAFVLIASLLVSAALGVCLPRGSLWLDAVNQVVSAAVFSALFGFLFRYLPDARIPWRWALQGGLVTAVLFALGKWAIGIYLARGDVGGAYGAAGSLAVLLVWVYYAGAIVFYGAELTKVWMANRGVDITPLEHAERPS
jgi:membrane protein